MPITAIIYLIIALLSYLTSRKAGLSSGKSALIAAGVTGLAASAGVGDKIEGWFSGLSGDSSSVDLSGDSAISDSWWDDVSAWFGSNAGKLGTIAAAGGLAVGTGAVGTSLISSITKNLPLILAGFGAYFFLTRRSSQPQVITLQGSSL